MNSAIQHPLFLGPYGENDTLLEQLAEEFMRDHVYWRRIFHPEDPPAIPTSAAQTPEFPVCLTAMAAPLRPLELRLPRHRRACFVCALAGDESQRVSADSACHSGSE